MEKDLLENIQIIKNYIYSSYKKNTREGEEGTILPYPFIVPGACYSKQLWDWDAWLTGYALMHVDSEYIEKYQKGCVLDFLYSIDNEGRIPIVTALKEEDIWFTKLGKNIHKPCLALQALEISNYYNEVEWIRSEFDKILLYLSFYDKYQKHEETGLYYWLDDFAIGFDNNPTVFYRPDCSTGDIYLNSLMYSELLAVSELANKLGKEDIYKEYKAKAEALKTAINSECFDEVDGYYYSVDLTLRKVDKNEWLHSGQPRFWHSLPIKITTWAGMLPLWNGIASQEQADKAVKRYLNPNGLFAKYGIRSIGKNEKMYCLHDGGNPSCWLGPIWINANYFTYMGLKRYGYKDLAYDIAVKTINLLAEDLKRSGQFSEMYDPNTGASINAPGFQSWNFLVILIIQDLEKEIK